MKFTFTLLAFAFASTQAIKISAANCAKQDDTTSTTEHPYTEYIMNEIDKNCDKEIDLGEFIDVWKGKLYETCGESSIPKDSCDKLKDVVGPLVMYMWRSADKDNTGTIDRSELSALLHKVVEQ